MNKKISNEEKELAQIIGKRLLYLRQHYDLSQNELGIQLGITQRSISLWESGNAAIPTRYLIKICKKFKISLSYFDPREKGIETILNQYDMKEQVLN